MEQNFKPGGDILLNQADLDIHSFPTTFFHTFSLGDKWAQLLLMLNPTQVKGTLLSDSIDLPFNQVNSAGFSDGFVGLKMGLINAPALKLSDFATRENLFTLSAYLRIWGLGSYDSGKKFNIGTNRATIEIGAPMAIPLSQNKQSPTWLEVFPSIRFYTDNTDPVGNLDRLEQAPLFILENHLTHNFNPKLWASANLRYQFGGETTTDGVANGNDIHIMGGGFGLGLQALPYLAFNADYGAIFLEENEAFSRMFRVGAVFTYAKVPKTPKE
jgi:hypothetical protein